MSTELESERRTNRAADWTALRRAPSLEMPKIDPERSAEVPEQMVPARISSRAAGGSEAHRSRNRARFEALGELLADEAPFVWEEVRRQFESAGRAGRPALERAARSENPQARSRARTLLQEHDRRGTLRRLVRYAARGRVDLEKSLFLLARFHEPHLDPRPFQRRLDEIAREVSARARLRTDALQRALVLVEHLGVDLGYGGTKGDFHHPDNIHIQRVIERRSGMPLTLCALYMLVARRAGLRASCVPLPGHVMLRLHGSNSSVIVDPYHKGQVRSERDCRKYLEQNGLPFKAAWFRDADDGMLLKRQVANLARSAQLRGLPRERRELQILAFVLEPRSSASQAPSET